MVQAQQSTKNNQSWKEGVSCTYANKIQGNLEAFSQKKHAIKWYRMKIPLYVTCYLVFFFANFKNITGKPSMHTTAKERNGTAYQLSFGVSIILAVSYFQPV